MKTERPETDARSRTPENPIGVQGPVTPLTGQTPTFNEHHVWENKSFPDKQLCDQEKNSSLEQKKSEPLEIKEEQLEPEPLPIKEEQEEFWTNQRVEQFIQKQETDSTSVTSISVENEHREPEPNSDQLLCLASAVSENREEEGSQHVDSGSAESDELKPKKRHLKTRIHVEGYRGLRPVPASLDERQGTPWTDRQSITGPTQRQTTIHCHIHT
ncbi:uncharacterized protein KZ484_000188 [Pholidichthys leucotaenia]